MWFGWSSWDEVETMYGVLVRSFNGSNMMVVISVLYGDAKFVIIDCNVRTAILIFGRPIQSSDNTPKVFGTNMTYDHPLALQFPYEDLKPGRW